jgi:quercetin dioxygenase-like cupin family protein
MKVLHVDDVEHPAPGKFLARPLLEGQHSNVRMIRLAAGQALPPHRHGESDLILFAVAGSGELDAPNGAAPFNGGWIYLSSLTV